MIRQSVSALLSRASGRRGVNSDGVIFWVSGCRFPNRAIVRVPMPYWAAVRASGAAGLGARAQRLLDDGLQGTRTAAALGAAAETAVDLSGVAGKFLR